MGHVRTPQSRPQNEPGKRVGFREDEISRYQGDHPSKQERTRFHSIAKSTGRISERDISEIEDRKRQR